MSPAKSQQETRKQTETAGDGTVSGKPAPPRAWTTGTNPITQKSSSPAAVNGMANGHVQGSQERGSANKSGAKDPEKYAHDRLLYLYSSLIGLDVTVALKNGDRFAGLFAGAATQHGEPRYLLKMVRKVASNTNAQTNGTPSATTELVGDGEDHTKAFEVTDVVDLAASNVQLGSRSTRAANGSAFRTDVEISGKRNGDERVLQRWAPGPEDDINMTLGSSDGPAGSWDQFATNERLYNVRSDYNEDMYTTSIDRSNPQYKQIAERAERLAREIEREGDARRSQGPVDSGLDEEDKYSGVRRDAPSLGKGGPNAYVPPSRRPITNQPTVSGAPFDPAIISSQLSKPETTSSSSVPPQPPKDKDVKATAAVSAAAENVQSAKEAAPQTAVDAPATKTPAPRAPSAAEAIAPSTTAADNSANIMRNVTDAFKQFNAAEKLRFQQQQRQNQQQRARDAKQEKSVKLNDLKKFSQNFKLTSRVPEDLVPILAKTKEKQDEIKAKAEQQATEKEERRAQGLATPPSLGRSSGTQATQQGSQTNELAAETAPHLSVRTRSQQQGRAPLGAAASGRGSVQTNQRGSIPFRQGPSGTIPQPIPIPIPQTIPQPKGEEVLSPTSATIRFNAKAMEFKPNPAASTFTPTGPAGSASPSKRPSIAASPSSATAVATPTSDFFAPSAKKSKLADGDWESTTEGRFSTVKRLYDQSDEQKRAQFAANGGIPQGYRTGPVWDTTPENQDKSYLDMFPKSIHQHPPSPLHASQNGAMPHSHQLPPHLHNNMSQYPQNPAFYRPQPHTMGSHHGEDQRMHYSSSTSSVQPSPRMGQPQMAFAGQTQLPGYGYGMPGGGLSPGMGMRSMPAGGQYMTPQGTPMGGQMMVQQQSSGPYMAHPGQVQMPGYPSPAPSHAQPHFAGHMGQMGMPGAYGGNPRGHPMSHQGSQQGHTPQPMYMVPGQPGMMMMPQQHGAQGPMRYGQPQFAGQMPQHPYAMQQRAMSNGGYGQHLTPRQQVAMPHQPGGGPPPMRPSPSTNGEDAR